jgi:hypothetical protein
MDSLEEKEGIMMAMHLMGPNSSHNTIKLKQGIKNYNNLFTCAASCPMEVMTTKNGTSSICPPLEFVG